MNWEAIGLISTAFGSLAVFATLVYLAIQVRHARREVRRSLSQGRGEAIRGLLMARATDERLAAALENANAALGDGQHLFVATLVRDVRASPRLPSSGRHRFRG